MELGVALLISLIITWGIGLMPPLLIRFVLLKRPMGKGPAVGTCALFLIVNLMIFIALGSESKSHGAVALIAIASYYILRKSAAEPKPEEKSTEAEVTDTAISSQKSVVGVAKDSGNSFKTPLIVLGLLVIGGAIYLLSQQPDPERMSAERFLNEAAETEQLVVPSDLKPLETTGLKQASSNFVQVDLPRGVSIVLPKGWRYLDETMNRLIETSLEAVIDVSGIDIGEARDDDEAVLVAANSTPASTYAAVRVTSVRPPTISLTEAKEVTNRDLAALKSEMIEPLQKMMAAQGNELLEYFGYRKDRIGGHEAFVLEYRRTGPNGPVMVQVNQIAAPSQTITVNLSYRESETALWKPILAKVRGSITITQ